ncbi:flap endonuclease GEN homolog 1 [Elysia marginata]|uniref:Flap endonuclease GEN homolog 1 n=1 Tax=Elysia marginata TaxID=1093978 RepID=A0AAV4EDL9_9GAST|nr:flap endonuclease GEN homolog 1 [Elysia marginata]
MKKIILFSNRGLFFRTLNLSKLGIILVFVIDGPHAPPKKGKYNREAFFQECQQYKILLTGMGFLVLEAKGEAEKMCAELNMKNLVDGVLTSDGDALVYGAQVVYKGILTEKKEQKATKFTMEKINSKLHMNHKDIVAFAILSKGDISDGVHSVGEKKFLELHKEFKNNGIKDSLERLKSWVSDTKLCGLENQLLGMPKISHCTFCGHKGTKNQHSKIGCSVCGKDKGCLLSQQASECKAEGVKHPLCMCTVCLIQRAVKPYTHELKVRRLALKQDANFPREDIINEFLSPCNTLPAVSDVCLKVPNLKAVFKVLHEKLRFSQDEAAKHLIPWIIKLSVLGILPGLTVEPVKILKSCTEQFEKCYTVQWSKLDIDDLSVEAKCYEFNISASLFASKYPELCKKFETASYLKKGKRKITFDPNQRKLSDMFKVVKKSVGNTAGDSKSTPQGDSFNLT